MLCGDEWQRACGVWLQAMVGQQLRTKRVPSVLNRIWAHEAQVLPDPLGWRTMPHKTTVESIAVGPSDLLAQAHRARTTLHIFSH